MLLTARIFVKRADGGRSRPPQCIAEDEAGGFHDVFIKSPTLHRNLRPESLVVEHMASNAARALRLPAAEVAPLRLTGEFLHSLECVNLKDQLSAGPELVLGSLNVGAGFNRFSSRDRFPRNYLPVLSSIYLFDVATENLDRELRNPNLLVRGDHVAMIDHEEAFFHALASPDEGAGVPYPWEPSWTPNTLPGSSQHPLWPRLRPASEVSFAGACSAWSALPDAAFAIYADAVSNEWDRSAARRISDYLEQAKERIPDLCHQAYRRLTK